MSVIIDGVDVTASSTPKPTPKPKPPPVKPPPTPAPTAPPSPVQRFMSWVAPGHQDYAQTPAGKLQSAERSGQMQKVNQQAAHTLYEVLSTANVPGTMAGAMLQDIVEQPHNFFSLTRQVDPRHMRDAWEQITHGNIGEAREQYFPTSIEALKALQHAGFMPAKALYAHPRVASAVDFVGSLLDPGNVLTGEMAGVVGSGVRRGVGMMGRHAAKKIVEAAPGMAAEMPVKALAAAEHVAGLRRNATVRAAGEEQARKAGATAAQAEAHGAKVEQSAIKFMTSQQTGAHVSQNVIRQVYGDLTKAEDREMAHIIENESDLPKNSPLYKKLEARADMLTMDQAKGEEQYRAMFGPDIQLIGDNYITHANLWKDEEKSALPEEERALIESSQRGTRINKDTIGKRRTVPTIKTGLAQGKEINPEHTFAAENERKIRVRETGYAAHQALKEMQAHGLMTEIPSELPETQKAIIRYARLRARSEVMAKYGIQTPDELHSIMRAAGRIRYAQPKLQEIERTAKWMTPRATAALHRLADEQFSAEEAQALNLRDFNARLTEPERLTRREFQAMKLRAMAQAAGRHGFARGALKTAQRFVGTATGRAAELRGKIAEDLQKAKLAEQYREEYSEAFGAHAKARAKALDDAAKPAGYIPLNQLGDLRTLGLPWARNMYAHPAIHDMIREWQAATGIRGGAPTAAELIGQGLHKTSAAASTMQVMLAAYHLGVNLLRTVRAARPNPVAFMRGMMSPETLARAGEERFYLPHARMQAQASWTRPWADLTRTEKLARIAGTPQRAIEQLSATPLYEWAEPRLAAGMHAGMQAPWGARKALSEAEAMLKTRQVLGEPENIAVGERGVAAGAQFPGFFKAMMTYWPKALLQDPSLYVAPQAAIEDWNESRGRSPQPSDRDTLWPPIVQSIDPVTGDFNMVAVPSPADRPIRAMNAIADAVQHKGTLNDVWLAIAGAANPVLAPGIYGGLEAERQAKHLSDFGHDVEMAKPPEISPFASLGAKIGATAVGGTTGFIRGAARYLPISPPAMQGLPSNTPWMPFTKRELSPIRQKQGTAILAAYVYGNRKLGPKFRIGILEARQAAEKARQAGKQKEYDQATAWANARYAEMVKTLQERQLPVP